jgi:iron complex outermembrane recepter protein
VRTVLCSLLPLALLSTAHAEEGTPASQVAVVLDTIVVTARKQDELLHEVPESVAVISGDTIEARGLDTIGALDSQVANLQVSDANGVSTIALRGIGGGGRTVGVDPRTGVFLDGVYMGFPPSANALLLDLARVEVIRGPQGTLFGQNAVSGAVHLITRTPADTFGTQGLWSYGRGNEARFAGAMDAPLVADRLLVRASVGLSRRDGFVENVFDGSRTDEGEDASGRLRLRYKLSPAAFFDLSADQARQSTHRPTGDAFTNTSGTGPANPPDRYTVNLNTAQKDDNENGGVAGTFEWKGGNLEVVAISAYRRAAREWIIDLDYSPADIGTLDYDDRYRMFSQELRVAARWPGLSVLGGVYVFDTRAESSRLASSGEDVKQFPPFSQALSPGDSFLTVPEVRSRAYAAFASVGHEPAARWRLDAGLRVTRTFKDLEYDQTSSAGYAAIGVPNVSGYRDALSETAVTPEGAVSFAASDRATVYLRYARGFKNGGFDADLGRQPRPEPGRFDQETVNSYEIGAKTRWFANRLRADFNLFLSDFRDYQVTQFVQSGNFTLPTTTNAGEVRTWGAELGLSAAPLRGLRLALDAGWLHAEYERFEDGAVIAGEPQDYSGNRAEFAPEWTVAAAVDYRLPLPWHSGTEGFAGVDWSYRSDYDTQASNDPRLRAGSRSLLNARMGFTAWGGRLQAALYVDNALDDRYFASLNRSTLGAFNGRLGDPRTYGVRFRVSTN